MLQRIQKMNVDLDEDSKIDLDKVIDQIIRDQKEEVVH